MGAFIAHNKETLVLWIGAICTLGLYSVLYKENKVFRIFEHIFLGLATGYMIATQWNDTIKPKWWTPFRHEGQWILVFALCAGALYYLIYSKHLNWLARVVIGLFLGQSAGMQFQAFTNDVWPQIYGSFKPVLPHGAIQPNAVNHLKEAIPAVGPADAINNLIFMFILLCVMSYFFFSFEQKHAITRQPAKWGRWLMMFTFGAIFGQTIMARLALLIDRMSFMLNEFGPKLAGPKYGPAASFVLMMVLAGIVLFLSLRQNPDAEAGAAEQ
jgi:hypothetical protein